MVAGVIAAGRRGDDMARKAFFPRVRRRDLLAEEFAEIGRVRGLPRAYSVGDYPPAGESLPRFSPHHETCGCLKDWLDRLWMSRYQATGDQGPL
jgi:hypothetical protein